MDMRFIEVGIGLTIVFAMASLLASAMMEAWSSYRSLRGRNLMNALVSFVGDDKEFARRLMRHPLMVSLSVGHKDEARCPAYISPDVVVTSLLGLLVDNAADGERPQTPDALIELLEQAVKDKKAWAPDIDFVRGLKSLTYGIDDWSTFEARVGAWYSAVGERSIDWYKRKVQVRLFICGFVIALVGNINPLELAPSLWSNEPVRIGLVGTADAVLEARPTESRPNEPVPALPAGAVATLTETVSTAKSGGLPLGWSVPFPPRQWSSACAWEGESFGPSGCSRWAMLFNMLVVLVGWSITAIACTLGAPFWFDVLSKAAKLRATGNRSESTEQKSDQPSASGLRARPPQ